MLHLRDIPNDDILACPDPTGRQQQTSSALGLSERTILARRGFKARAPKTPWSIRDKVAATCLLIKAANAHRRLKVEPSSNRVIRSLSNPKYRTGSSIPDPKNDHSHRAVAVDYIRIALPKRLLPWSIGVTRFRIS